MALFVPTDPSTKWLRLVSDYFRWEFHLFLYLPKSVNLLLFLRGRFLLHWLYFFLPSFTMLTNVLPSLFLTCFLISPVQFQPKLTHTAHSVKRWFKFAQMNGLSLFQGDKIRNSNNMLTDEIRKFSRSTGVRSEWKSHFTPHLFHGL